MDRQDQVLEQQIRALAATQAATPGGAEPPWDPVSEGGHNMNSIQLQGDDERYSAKETPEYYIVAIIISEFCSLTIGSPAPMAVRTSLEPGVRRHMFQVVR